MPRVQSVHDQAAARASHGAAAGDLPGLTAWALVVAVVVAAALVRGHWLDVPLERDEGEYAYAGQLLLQGVPPYRLAYNMKLPGTYVAYAGLMAVFGQSTAGVHLGLIVVTSITTVLVFLLGRRLFGDRAGVVAALTHALLAMGPNVLGMAAHATHFVALFATAGAVVLLRATDGGRRRDLFLSGLLFGIAFLMKQHGLLFTGFGLMWIVIGARAQRPRAWAVGLRRAAVFVGGVALPFIGTGLLLAAAGVLDRAWFWTFTYASRYVTGVPLSDAGAEFTRAAQSVVGLSAVPWLAAAAGAVLAWRRPAWRSAAVFVSGLFAFGFLAACPGLYFRGHYFIVMLPAVALFAGAAGAAAWERWGGAGWTRPALALAALAGVTAWQHHFYLLDRLADDISRAVYPDNPFVEAAQVARYIAERSEPGDRVVVLGSEPEVYFNAGRRSATGYIYMYPLMEPHPYAAQMQRDLIAEVEAAEPTFLVLVSMPTSWMRRPESPDLVMKWGEPYCRQHYDPVGLIDLTDPTTYHWDAAARSRRPRSPFQIWVYRRRVAS